MVSGPLESFLMWLNVIKANLKSSQCWSAVMVDLACITGGIVCARGQCRIENGQGHYEILPA